MRARSDTTGRGSAEQAANLRSGPRNNRKGAASSTFPPQPAGKAFFIPPGGPYHPLLLAQIHASLSRLGATG